MNEELIKKIQMVEYDALKEFKSFCDENKIDFFLRGGSVLGAVKYQGFIPWDDDLDVAVPRSDYEKLISLSKDLILSDKYKINSYRHCDELHCYFPRMVLLEKERIRLNLPKNTELGLHLMDIFPLDGAPNNYFNRMFYCLKIYFYRALASLGTNYNNGNVNMHTKVQQSVINLLKLLKIDQRINQKSVYQKLERVYSVYDWKEKKYAGTPTASLFTKEIMPKEIWGDGVVLKFVDLDVKVPCLYDDYLKKLYGDNYMYEEPDDDNKKSHLGEI